MSDQITRKRDTGEPGNPGQFGSTGRAASGLTLDTASRPGAVARIEVTLTAEVRPTSVNTVPDFPEHLGEPEVSFGYDDSGERNTYVWFGDEYVAAWDDGTGVMTSFDIGDGPSLSEADQAPVTAWVKAVHRNATTVVAHLEGALEGDARVQEAVSALATGRPLPDPAASFDVSTYDGKTPLPRPLADAELATLIRRSPDGHTLDAMVRVPVDHFLEGVKAGAEPGSDVDEHDVLASYVHPGLSPYDCSYRIAGTDTDGNLLVHYFHGDGGYEHIVDTDA